MKTTQNFTAFIKDYALALFALAGIILLLIFSFNSQAYEVPRVQETIEEDHLVNKGTNGFEQRPTVDPLEDCIDLDDYNCAYNVTPLGKMNIPEKASYTRTEIDFYESQNWIQPHPESSPALYDN